MFLEKNAHNNLSSVTEETDVCFFVETFVAVIVTNIVFPGYRAMISFLKTFLDVLASTVKAIHSRSIGLFRSLLTCHFVGNSSIFQWAL